MSMISLALVAFARQKAAEDEFDGDRLHARLLRNLADRIELLERVNDRDLERVTNAALDAVRRAIQ